MSVRVPVGTEEYLRVTVKDATGVLTTLTGTSPTFDVKDAADVAKYTAQAATPTDLVGLCLVDTAGWTPGEFRLWFQFVTGAETVRLGPFPFTVSE